MYYIVKIMIMSINVEYLINLQIYLTKILKHKLTKDTKIKILEYFKLLYIKTKNNNGDIYNLKYAKIIMDYFKN